MGSTAEAVLLAELVKQQKETNKLLRMIVDEQRAGHNKPPLPRKF